MIKPFTLVGAVGNVSGENYDATFETNEPPISASTSRGLKTVWYQWTATASGTIIFKTLGSNFDTLLEVYIGASLNTLVSVGANDDDPDGGGNSSKVSFAAVAGTTYRIAVDGYKVDETAAQGAILLSWSDGTGPGTIILGAGPTYLLEGAGVERGFRKIKGHEDIWRLMEALLLPPPGPLTRSTARCVPASPLRGAPDAQETASTHRAAEINSSVDSKNNPLYASI